MSSFEQEPNDNIAGDTQESDIKKDSAVTPVVTSKAQLRAPKSSWFSMRTGGVAAIGVLIFLYSIIEFEKPEPDTTATNLVPAFDERLISCNQLRTPVPSPSYDTCLSAAQDGDVLAIKRFIWAYSRQSENQDLGKVFEWLRALPYKDDATQLLMFSLVHLNTASANLRKDSELGISRLVAKNYAPANVVLAAIYALNENVTPPTSNTIWLLNRAFNKDPMTIDASMLATIYANGFLSEVDVAAASSVLKSAAQTNYPMTTNNVAWFLATLDNNPFTPTEYAVSLASQVIEDSQYSQNHIYVDTFAAALAADQRFDEAISAQELALNLLQQSDLDESLKSHTQAAYENRLALYKNNQTLIERTLATDRTAFFKSLRNRVLEYVLRDFFIPIEIPASFVSKADAGSVVEPPAQ